MGSILILKLSYIIRNLRSAPPKILFVISCILFLACIPVR